MFTQTKVSKYYLAFSPHLKVRPNYGLKGLGYYTSKTYHHGHYNYWKFFAPIMLYLLIKISGDLKTVEHWFHTKGGGSRPYTRDDFIKYGFNRKVGNFGEYMPEIGEGYAAGPPRYRRDPKAPPLMGEDY